jgi:hypothetical protein
MEILRLIVGEDPDEEGEEERGPPAREIWIDPAAMRLSFKLIPGGGRAVRDPADVPAEPVANRRNFL